MINQIHIGQCIKEKFEERQIIDKSLTKASFARQINIHRSTLYLLFNQKSIDIELLINISKALNYDFIENIYLHKKTKTKNRMIIGIEIDTEQFQQMNLPEKYLQLIEQVK